jgi:hypothetical protein
MSNTCTGHFLTSSSAWSPLISSLRITCRVVHGASELWDCIAVICSFLSKRRTSVCASLYVPPAIAKIVLSSEVNQRNHSLAQQWTRGWKGESKRRAGVLTEESGRNQLLPKAAYELCRCNRQHLSFEKRENGLQKKRDTTLQIGGKNETQRRDRDGLPCTLRFRSLVHLLQRNTISFL